MLKRSRIDGKRIYLFVYSVYIFTFIGTSCVWDKQLLYVQLSDILALKIMELTSGFFQVTS